MADPLFLYAFLPMRNDVFLFVKPGECGFRVDFPTAFPISYVKNKKLEIFVVRR